MSSLTNVPWRYFSSFLSRVCDCGRSHILVTVSLDIASAFPSKVLGVGCWVLGFATPPAQHPTPNTRAESALVAQLPVLVSRCFARWQNNEIQTRRKVPCCRRLKPLCRWADHIIASGIKSVYLKVYASLHDTFCHISLVK